MRRFITRLVTLALTATALTTTALPASADHIRAMTVYQVAGSATSNEVTVRVDYNYSGNCCGGAFTWWTGETPQRIASVPDGIVNGAYVGDQALTTALYNDGSTYQWTRYRPDPTVPLVRIDLTWTYYNAGVYDMTWDDCCPQSNNKAVVVAGQAFQPRRILTADTGNPSVAAAYAQAAIPVCGTVMNNEPLCYELLNAAQIPAANLNTYAAVLVPSEAPAAINTALGLQTGNFDTWLRNGRRGIAVYGQSGADFSWLPTAGQTLTPAATLANNVTVTPSGMLHMSHVNQLPTVAAVNGTLAAWNVSTYNTFTAYPTYFQHTAGNALAELSSNQAVVALGGLYDGSTGCQIVTGQPIDDRAVYGPTTAQRAAQQMFRSTLAYVLSCVDAARV
jgi:hypothetical protein